MEQYNALLTAAPLLESVLRKNKIQVARPDYEAGLSAAEQFADEREEGQQSAAKVDDDNDEE